MSYIPDMEVLGSGSLAVGWLEPEFPYRRGTLPPGVSDRLGEIARRWFESVEALGLGVAMGYHTCGLCGKAWGSGTFGVPAGDTLFYCPELIAHYVVEHDYAPPDEFVNALMASPLPGTPEYAEAVKPIVARRA